MTLARRDHGFTFVEVLASLVFLAILMPVLISALTLSNRASVVAERSSVAIQLAENKLNELQLADAWMTAGSRGEFENDRAGYRWEMTQSDWEGGEMVELRLRVLFEVQGQEREVHLSTLVNETPLSTAL